MNLDSEAMKHHETEKMFSYFVILRDFISDHLVIFRGRDHSRFVSHRGPVCGEGGSRDHLGKLVKLQHLLKKSFLGGVTSWNMRSLGQHLFELFVRDIIC